MNVPPPGQGAPGARMSALPDWLQLAVAVGLVYTLFDSIARAWGSDRGQHGLAVGIVVVAATIAIDRAFFGLRDRPIVTTLGLGRPHSRGILIAAAISALLLATIPIFALVTGASVVVDPHAAVLAAGMAMQAGVAEELLFRGFLFGHLRRQRTFWRAAVASLPPFLVVHLFLVFALPWPIALTAVMLSVALSFPLAQLYEIGGRTIWAPALVHFVIQAAVKLVVLSGDGGDGIPDRVDGAAAVRLVPAGRPRVRPTRCG